MSPSFGAPLTTFGGTPRNVAVIKRTVTRIDSASAFPCAWPLRSPVRVVRCLCGSIVAAFDGLGQQRHHLGDLFSGNDLRRRLMGGDAVPRFEDDELRRIFRIDEQLA